MLEPYIIDELKRRDAERQRRSKRPRVELPVPPPPGEAPARRPPAEELPDGGVIIIDL